MIPAIACTLALLAPQQESEFTLTVDRLHVGDGTVLENATVTVSGGRISAVVAGGEGEGEADGMEMTPGLVDAFSFMGIGPATLEQSRETTASLRVADTADLDSPAFRNAVGEGVTSAYLSPDSLNVFSGIGAFVKTSGGAPADLYAEEGSAARVVDGAAALKIVLGSDASRGNFTPRGRFTTSFNQRRPNTRMGTVWVVRRDFYRAMDYAARKEAGEALYDRDLEVLVAALEGRIPVRFQARRSHDLQTALRLREEFDLRNVILEEATEGHLAADAVAAAGVPVVCGPAYDSVARAVAIGPLLEELRLLVDPPPVCCEDLHEEFGGEPVGEAHDHDDGMNPVAMDLLLTLAPRYGAAAGIAPGRRREGQNATPALAPLLAEAGVDFALGSAEAHDDALSEASLIQQARTAVRWGMDPAQVLPLITARAAELAGKGDSVGKVAVGYDADLVLWSGPPLDSASRPLLVIVDGRVVLDNRIDS